MSTPIIVTFPDYSVESQSQKRCRLSGQYSSMIVLCVHQSMSFYINRIISCRQPSVVFSSTFQYHTVAAAIMLEIDTSYPAWPAELPRLPAHHTEPSTEHPNTPDPSQSPEMLKNKHTPSRWTARFAPEEDRVVFVIDYEPHSILLAHNALVAEAATVAVLRPS